MNEDLVIKLIKPYLNSKKEILYADFEDLFSFLERKEQYELTEFLFSNGVILVDKKSEDTPLSDTSPAKILSHKSIIVKKQNKNNSIIIKKSTRKKRNSYLKESNEYLVELYQKTEDKNILQILIDKNKKYLYKLIKRNSYFFRHSLEDEDLYQIAVIGFIEGCQRFDHNKGYNLLTYVTFWINQIIRRVVIDTGFIIRLPVHKWEQIIKVSKQFSRHKEEDFEDLPDQELEKYKDIMILKQNYLNPKYLDDYAGENRDTNIIDLVSNNAQCLVSKFKQPEEYVSEREMFQLIENSLDSLSLRGKDVIMLRFGLESNPEMTLNEIGEKFGVTRERIRQIEEKSLSKLRKNFKNKFAYQILDLLDDKTSCLKNFNPLYNFKKNGISYLPDEHAIIERIIKLNKNEEDLEILYNKVVDCAKQNSYNEKLLNHDEIIVKIKNLKEI